MSKLFTKVAIAVGAIAALPSAAQAGTATATGTATLTVTTQCTVSGANVDLGTYRSNQSWGDVANALGNVDVAATFHAGSLGMEYLNFGSVTCGAGTPYALTILGDHPTGGFTITHNGYFAVFIPAIKKLGGVTLADKMSYLPGVGHSFLDDGSDLSLAGVGTGSGQELVGSAILFFPSVVWNAAQAGQQLGGSGTSSATMTYTLNF